MTTLVFHGEGYEKEYIEARHRIDGSCLKIAAGIVTATEARREYEGIEQEYVRNDPEKAELFTMIYANRIERLSRQFRVGGE